MDFPKHLPEQATIFRAEDELGRGATPLEGAADLIEQQARDIAALRQDIEAQIQIAKEACERADGFERELRLIGGANSVDMALDPTWAKRIAVAALMPNQVAITKENA